MLKKYLLLSISLLISFSCFSQNIDSIIQGFKPNKDFLETCKLRNNAKQLIIKNKKEEARIIFLKLLEQKFNYGDYNNFTSLISKLEDSTLAKKGLILLYKNAYIKNPIDTFIIDQDYQINRFNLSKALLQKELSNSSIIAKNRMSKEDISSIDSLFTIDQKYRHGNYSNNEMKHIDSLNYFKLLDILKRNKDNDISIVESQIEIIILHSRCSGKNFLEWIPILYDFVNNDLYSNESFTKLVDIYSNPSYGNFDIKKSIFGSDGYAGLYENIAVFIDTNNQRINEINANRSKLGLPCFDEELEIAKYQFNENRLYEKDNSRQGCYLLRLHYFVDTYIDSNESRMKKDEIDFLHSLTNDNLYFHLIKP